MSRNIVLIIYLIVSFICRSSFGEGSKIQEIVILLFFISLVLCEIYERRKNIKNGSSKFDEKILVRKGAEFYLSMLLALLGIIIFSIIVSIVAKQYELYENILTPIGIALIGVLPFFYGYLYIVSNQILYKDGIKLADNKFINKEQIEGVSYRRTFIKNKRLIEISLKASLKVDKNKIIIKCENEEEFIKVIDALEGITGEKAKNLEW